MTWPQGIMVGWLVLGLIYEAINDGEPRTGNHKFGMRLIRCAGLVALLWWGGFFSQLH